MKYTNALSATALVAYCFLTMACTSSEQKDAAAAPAPGYSMPYRLHQPDTTFYLPPALREISGLTLSPDGAHLLAVNDETGTIFYLNPQTGAVERTRVFGKTGDYEGIEVVGNDVFVVKSDGAVTRIPESGEPETWATPLDRSYDVEGLCYDAAQHRLLLACKGKADKGGAYKGKKALYAFDLATKKLTEKPAFLLDQSELARMKGADSGFFARLFGFFTSEKAASAFGPSGLAVHPLDSNLYVVAAAGRTLAVVHPDGRLLHAERLNPNLFPQPEGLCFDREGRLYIATEGRKVQGRVLRFEGSF
ncbi:MAG: SdiA-regulated domain-containing protein [Lewinellaceae bacterium]|nr:SdiA-regulated domain-containing protein [Lewinellaceae bacterium]